MTVTVTLSQSLAPEVLDWTSRPGLHVKAWRNYWKRVGKSARDRLHKRARA